MVPQSVAVRPAEPADAEEIGRIHVASWQSAYAGALPEDFLRRLSVQDSQDAWRERLAATALRALVVTREATVAGFGCVGPSRDDGAEPEVANQLRR